MAESFNAQLYWERRLTERHGLDAVGWAGLGQGFNRWMYRLRGRIFHREVTRHVTDPATTDVLDIGSGSGFYIDRWRELGVRSVTGSDITGTAVTRLEAKYPGQSFVRFDAGGDPPGSFDRRFEVVSAFDVLFHIVDDARFRAAMHTLGALTKPGGHLVFSDNFVHGDGRRQSHHVNRSLDEIVEAAAAAGFEVVSRRPMFFLMNDPLDSRSRLLRFWWSGLTTVLERANSNALGTALGAALYPLDVLLTSIMSEGPSTELMICRRLP